MSQGIEEAVSIIICSYDLEVAYQFTYLGSAIDDTISRESQLNKQIRRAFKTMSRLVRKVWNNKNMIDQTKVQVNK